MTAQNLLKLLALVSLAMTAAALFVWRETGVAAPRWMLQVSLAAFALALVVGLFGKETRPRMMLRFVAALAALVSAISLVADLSHDGGGFTSLLTHIGQYLPSVLASVQDRVTKTLGAAAWDPVMTSILKIPTFILFALLAAVCGYASRHRKNLNIFAN